MNHFSWPLLLLFWLRTNLIDSIVFSLYFDRKKFFRTIFCHPFETSSVSWENALWKSKQTEKSLKEFASWISDCWSIINFTFSKLFWKHYTEKATYNFLKERFWSAWFDQTFLVLNNSDLISINFNLSLKLSICSWNLLLLFYLWSFQDYSFSDYLAISDLSPMSHASSNYLTHSHCIVGFKWTGLVLKMSLILYSHEYDQYSFLISHLLNWVTFRLLLALIPRGALKMAAWMQAGGRTAYLFPRSLWIDNSRSQFPHFLHCHCLHTSFSRNVI